MSIVSIDKDEDRLRLVIVAEFAAPVERVWQLWADPRRLERWWGPPSHPSTVQQHDLAPGGTVRYVLTGPEGETSRGWWRITAVDPPTDRASTWTSWSAGARSTCSRSPWPRWTRSSRTEPERPRRRLACAGSSRTSSASPGRSSRACWT